MHRTTPDRPTGQTTTTKVDPAALFTVTADGETFQAPELFENERCPERDPFGCIAVAQCLGLAGHGGPHADAFEHHWTTA